MPTTRAAAMLTLPIALPLALTAPAANAQTLTTPAPGEQDNRQPPAVLPVEAPQVEAPGPASPLDAINAPAKRLLPEGTRVARRTATLVQGPSGEWIASFDPSADTPIAPMITVPSRTLERVLEAGATTGAPVELSGTILLYKKRNYFVPTSFRIISNAADNETSGDALPEQPPATENAPEPPEGEGVIDADPLVADLIADLERARDAGEPALSVPIMASTQTVATVGEGMLVLRKRGRATRLNDGAWLFTPDADADDLATYTPMRLVPSAVLEDIERIAETLGPEFALEITGRTLAFEGVVYLRATSFLTRNPTQVVPLQ